MTPAHPLSDPSGGHPAGRDRARSANRFMLLTLFGQALAALAIGEHFGTLGLALGAGAALLALGLAAHFGGRGSPLAWLGLTVSNVGFVVLHIQLGRGTTEFHFGVFVLLGLLLAYGDWRPIVLAAGLFAVHHLAFDRLQAMGLMVYCLPEANLLKTLMHAVYVVAQTGVEIVLARELARAALESAELTGMVRRIDHGGRLCLDMAELPATAPTAVLLKRAMATLAEAMAEVKVAAGSIETTCSEVAAGSLDLSRRTEHQASNLQQTAASMEQLTGSVQSSAKSATDATQLARAASDAALLGGTAVGTVAATMASIAQSSRRIADINAVVDGIAFQTNILALNAAVEAARAGEHGRGFAVVATEVRQLAQRSAHAAREIKSLISESVQHVERGTDQVGTAGASMDDIVQQTARVTTLISAISGSADQQSLGIEQVGRAVTQLDAVTQQNAALVEQSTAAAESLKRQALQLNNVVNRFELSAAELAG
jgi:methyl-accepting chemotaxis protein